VEEYFKTFSRKDIEHLRTLKTLKNPKTLDDWMIPVAHYIDMDKVKYPLVMVQEYGLNIFRIASTLSLSLIKYENTKVYTQTRVSNVKKSKEKNNWRISYIKDGLENYEEFDFFINAAGFKSGEIDDMLGYSRDRLVEFKAAYVTKWESCDTLWPEVIFHGERGTPQGMAQFTPYPDGYFQLHGMTNTITLFDDGLVKSTKESAQPKLDQRFIDKIDKSWKFSDVKKRTKLAIGHVANFIPEFEEGEMSSKPLYGAQQIPGEDATLRASDVSFVDSTYARCEIVKASSVLSMADDIFRQLISLGYLNSTLGIPRSFKTMSSISEAEVEEFAKKLCLQRDYPTALAYTNT